MATGSGWFGALAVATCRQTVEGLLAPLSIAWQRMATLGSGWLRLAAGGYGKWMVRGLGRSHLSPDGGGVTRAAVGRLAADGYDLAYFFLE